MACRQTYAPCVDHESGWRSTTQRRKLKGKAVRAVCGGGRHGEAELAKCPVFCYDYHRFNQCVVPAGRPAPRTAGAEDARRRNAASTGRRWCLESEPSSTCGNSAPCLARALPTRCCNGRVRRDLGVSAVLAARRAGLSGMPPAAYAGESRLLVRGAPLIRRSQTESGLG
jgi:hypothetical protein